jgi:hypothetical protein
VSIRTVTNSNFSAIDVTSIFLIQINANVVVYGLLRV